MVDCFTHWMPFMIVENETSNRQHSSTERLKAHALAGSSLFSETALGSAWPHKSYKGESLETAESKQDVVQVQMPFPLPNQQC